MVRIESSTRVEARIARDFGTLPNCPPDFNAGRVVVHAASKPMWVIQVPLKTPTPQTSKTCN